MQSKYGHIADLLLLCCISAFSQVLLKKAAQKEHASFLRQYLNLYVITAYGLFLAVLAANIYLLRFIPVSVSSSVSESALLILSFVTGRIFFAEPVSAAQIIGALLVIAGIILVIL